MRNFNKQQRSELSDKYLKEIELLEFKNHKPYELSGVHQRAALARALARALSIICWEPIKFIPLFASLLNKLSQSYVGNPSAHWTLL
jgi:ABC-type taurine transport system ATPase subunit